MMTDISSDPASAAGASTENAGANSGSASNAGDTNQAASAAPTVADPAAAAAASAATPPVVDTPPAYTPNFKYKAALQEKEIDKFWHPLIKDADSEKKVKDLFSKVDAFDFMKAKRDELESQHGSLLNDYDQMSNTVTSFNKAVASDDLSSAFRLAGITRDQVFKWAQKQIQLMEMPADQRAEYERHEQARQQNSEWEDKYTKLQKQFEHTAVQARTTQLDVALSQPEVAKFAEVWDRNSETPGAFRNFVVQEARKVFYETNQDISPAEAVAMVMKRFGKFLPMGDAITQPPQAVSGNGSRPNPPVIPNVTGKASSPIKKVPRTLDDLKKLAREARD
jgi:hypothetical protein